MYRYTVTVYYTCTVDSRTDPKFRTVFFSFRFHASTHHCRYYCLFLAVNYKNTLPSSPSSFSLSVFSIILVHRPRPTSSGHQRPQEFDIGTDPHTDVCCHHSDAVGSRSPCTQCRLITDTADNGDEGHSSTHRIPTVGEEWGPSALRTGSGLNRPPSETGTRVNTVTLNAASVLPCGINLNGDEIDDDKTDAFGPFLSALMRDPTPTGRANDVISTITFGGSDALQTACRALCTEFIDIFQDEVAREPARIPPFDIDHKAAAQWEVPGNRTPLRPQTSQKEEAIHNNLQDLIWIGVVEKSNAVNYSHPVVVQKLPGQYSVCIDFRPVNNCAESASWLLPNIRAMFERIGARQPDIFGVMDLTAGYHQAPLTASAKILTAFICFLGIYQFTRLPFGLKRAPSYFQEMMATVVLTGHARCNM